MKFFFLTTLAAGLLIIGMIGTAGAVTVTDSYNPTDILMNESNRNVLWTFDLRDSGLPPLVASSATIYLNLRDDNASDSAEKFKIYSFDLTSYLTAGSSAWNANIDNSFNLTVTGLSKLNTTGLWDVKLSRQAGDFYFESATLSAEVPDSAPVPEPGTMMLLGFGMLGLVVYGKRRMNK